MSKRNCKHYFDSFTEEKQLRSGNLFEGALIEYKIIKVCLKCGKKTKGGKKYATNHWMGGWMDQEEYKRIL